MKKTDISVSGVLNNKWVKIALVVISIGIVVYVINYIIKMQKIASAAVGDMMGGVLIEQQTGINQQRQAVCKQVAMDCNDAIYRVVFTGFIFWVSDDSIVTALNKLVSEKEAALTSQFFRQISGDSLKDIVEGGYFVEANRKKITYRTSLS